MYSDEDISHLLGRAQAGSKEAYGELVEMMTPLIVTVIKKGGFRQQADLDNLVMDTKLRLLKLDVDTITGPAHVKNLFSLVAQRINIDDLKSQKRLKRIQPHAFHEDMPPLSNLIDKKSDGRPDARLIRNDLVEKILLRLDPPQQAVFRHHVLEGKNLNETAEATGISISIVSRCRDQIRETAQEIIDGTPHKQKRGTGGNGRH